MKTIKDIAKIAKVSPGTVDRVLHNRGGVAEKTELKIKKIIEDVGFKPNLIARNLVLNKIYDVAVLIPTHDTKSPFWELPKKGIYKAAQEVSDFGMKVIVYHFNQYDASSFEKKLDKILNSNTIDGIIIAPHFTKETLKRKNKFEELNIPYIFMNVDLQGLNNTSFVGQDSFKSGYLSAKLFNIGKLPKNSSILVMEIMEDIENYYGLDHRIKGFMDYFKNHESSLSIEKLRVSKYSKNSIFKSLTKKLINNNNIKGIFLPSSRINIIAEYLDELEIPMDIVIGYDITEKNIKYLNKELITFLICQEPYNQGYNSVKLMFDHLINKIELEKQYLSPIQIVIKENLEYYV